MRKVSQRAFIPLFLLGMCSLLISSRAMAQDARFWVAGNGNWEDASHWSLTENGVGGAGAPGSRDIVTISSNGVELVVRIGSEVEAGGLQIDGTRGGVTLAGDQGKLAVAGDIRIRGSVAWPYTGSVELTARRGVAELDLRGIPISGNVS
ncbi:MAG: hypothetical protein ABI373_04445, partial [Flavobacteriales bacterium]